MMAFWEPPGGPRGPATGQCCIPSKAKLVEPICGVWNQIWCRTRLPEGQKNPTGVKQTPPDPLEPLLTPLDPPNPFSDPTCNQYNPSRYLINHYHAKKTKISTETRKISKTARKRPKTAKNAKTQKV